MLEAVFEFIGGFLWEQILFPFLMWLVLWPVALLVCTPFLLLRALVSALFTRIRFLESLAGGYRSITRFWKSVLLS
jgi:hypothetical protein